MQVTPTATHGGAASGGDGSAEAEDLGVREQETHSIGEYRSRVRRLAAIYLGIVLTSSTAIALIVVQGKLFVTLTQRSNVETLTLAFIIVLFAYTGVVSAPGAWGALRIVYYHLPGWLGRDPSAVERRKHAALKPKRGEAASAYLNCLVRLEGRGDAPITVPLADRAGEMGAIVIEGARMAHEQAVQNGSNGVLAYFEQRIQDLARERDPRAKVEIVQWATIDEEQALQYGSLVTFSVSLAKQLGGGPLWPAVELSERDLERLCAEGADLCPILRDEAHLPDLEYEAEHRLPIIPEPLAFVSLSRSERRADPVASMGCALLVALAILGLIVLFILVPPWVPGK
jgi:hypothetical protein